ncbi:MAG: toxin-antitoxin system HicB family antitoxin [Coriobacteriia bacterium]
MGEYTFSDYRIEMRLDGGSYVAWLAEIPQLLVEASSAAGAIELLRDGFDIWAQEMADVGRSIQEPWGDQELSGRVLLRMPSSLHSRLAREAEHQGVSLNALLNVMLADAVGFARGERNAGQPKSPSVDRAHV